MSSSSMSCLSPLSAAAQGSAYLLTQRSWTSRIGTGFRKCSFSRPRRLVVTRPASSSTRRCFMTPKRVIGDRCSSALSVCPSPLNSASSSRRRVGSARALNTSSMCSSIRDRLVTCQRGFDDYLRLSVEPPEIHYTRTPDGMSIAYALVGEGPLDLLCIPGFVSHLEVLFEAPTADRYFGRLASFARLLIYDRRGQRRSDRPPEPPTLEEPMEDAHAVLAASGMDAVAVPGHSAG